MVIMVMAAAGTARPVIMRMPLSLTVRMAVPFLPVPAAMFACFLKMPMIFFAMEAAVIFSLMTVAVAFFLPMAMPMAAVLSAMTVMVFMGMSHHFRYQFRFQILGSFDSLQNTLSVQLLPRSSDDFGFPVMSAEQSHTSL